MKKQIILRKNINIDFECFKCLKLVSSLETCISCIPKNPDYLYAVEEIFYYGSVCSSCGMINVLDDSKREIFPKPKYKENIASLPDNLKKFYQNIQKAANNQMWEVVILLTRIIIMHIAVVEKAKDNDKFQYYIEYLNEKKLLNRDIINLLDFGRKWGNNLNHIIKEFENTNNNEENGKICLETVKSALENLYKYKDLLKKNKIKK